MSRRLDGPERRKQLVAALRDLEGDTSPNGRRLWMATVLLLSARNALARGEGEDGRTKLAEARAILDQVAPAKHDQVGKQPAPQPATVKVTEHG